MNYGDSAVTYFMKGYNCAQATAAAFADTASLDPKTVLTLMSGFGGGIGGQRETCGAVSGMVFALSLHCGSYDPQDLQSKTELYSLVREVCEEFTERFGTKCCRELLEKADCFPAIDPAERTAQYYKERPCAQLVYAAAEIAAKKINQWEHSSLTTNKKS